VEEATATASLTSLYSPVHAKKVAWRALRDIILETHVFDTSRQPASAEQDPSPGLCMGPAGSRTGLCVVGGGVLEHAEW
jgi:hypothetical protein